jgi:putative membrane protein
MQLKPDQVKRFLINFYLIGLLGFMIPYSRDIFIELTGLALVLNFVILLWFHEGSFKLDTILVFVFIFLAGYFIEVIGVETGMIFGDYTYGSALGLKIFDTPLMIGINWLMLSYCFASVLQPLKVHRMTKILLASSGMLIYDFVMEQSAPMLDLWTWKNDVIPLENYMAWFIIAFFFQLIFVFSGIRLKNPLAFMILLVQFLFFLALVVYKILVL